MGPERLLMMAAAPTAHSREIDRYLRWEYPRDGAPWALGRPLAAGGAPADRPARDSFIVRLGRRLTGRAGAVTRVAQALPR